MLVCKNCRGIIKTLYFECCECENRIHLQCIASKSTPGGLAGDIFFIFTCQDCNAGGTESFERMKMGWVDVILLIMHNLAKRYPKSAVDGYYHVERQIKKFLINQWNVIFPHMRTKRKSYQQMLELSLKKYPQYFQSLKTKEKGRPLWYKLARDDLLPNQALVDRLAKQTKIKIEQRNKRMKLDDEFESESSTDYESSRDGEMISTLDGSSFVESHLSGITINGDSDNMFSRSYVKPSPRLSEILFAGDEEACENDEDVDIEALEGQVGIDIGLASTSNDHIFLPTISDQSEDTGSVETDSLADGKEGCPGKCEFDVNEGWEIFTGRPLLPTNPKSMEMPWSVDHSISTSSCTPMNVAEELYTLQALSKKIEQSDAISVAELRLHRKLAVRKLRRERNIPVFNLDALSRQGGVPEATTTTSAPRVLDRFVRATAPLEPTKEGSSFWTRLMGLSEQYSCSTSPLTTRILKPFIRRDYESLPPWLKLCEELKERLGVECEPRSPIDYCYVRPHHIPAVNSLAEQYFWPGVNLSECLQYPDFSCVVLYKKLIVAFAFLVPDVDYTEAYISFIFTRPEWRRAGIATFMLYHLIQSCRGRDITLHVSATNPALFLYQKFGFKVECFFQDFYDKYLPLESNECRHAFFLRLAR